MEGSQCCGRGESQEGCGLRGIWRSRQKPDNAGSPELRYKVLSLSEASKGFEESYDIILLVF